MKRISFYKCLAHIHYSIAFPNEYLRYEYDDLLVDYSRVRCYYK